MAKSLLNRLFLKELNIEDLTEKDWEILIRQAKSVNLGSTLADKVLKKGVNLPEKAVLHLKSEQILTSRQIEATQYEFEKLKHVFLASAVKAVLLKGAAYIALNFEFAKHRKLSDIDILVDKLAINETERELIFYGWVPHQVDDYDQAYYREWMHEIPPMKHRKRSSIVDLHHNIFPPISGVSPDASLLLDQSVFIKEVGFWRLCNEDMFIHSAVHFFLQSETQNGLRDLHDMKQLFNIFSDEDKDFPHRLLMRAKQLNMAESVILALHYMGKIFNVRYSGKFENEISYVKPRLLSLWWLDFIYENILIPNHSSCETWRFNLAKYLVFWRGHIKKMPLKILIHHLFKKSFKRLTGLYRDESKVVVKLDDRI